METREPPPGMERATVPTAEQAAKKWERRRDHTPAETGVLRETATRPTSVTALRRALAQVHDGRRETQSVLIQLAAKLDHIHDDLRAVHDKLGIWREECGAPRPAPARREPEKKRKHYPEPRRRRR